MTTRGHNEEVCGVFGLRFLYFTAGVVLALFIAGVVLPEAARSLPWQWVPVVFAAGLVEPRAVAVLAALALGLEIVPQLVSGGWRDAGALAGFAARAALGGAAVLVAARVQALRAARREKELVLYNERRHLAEVVEGMNMGTWEWDVQTGATVFNEAWAQIVGYSLAELQPTSIETWLNLVHPEDLLRSNEELQRCFSRQTDIYECEVRMRHRNGNWVWVLTRGRVVEWEPDGKPRRMLGTHRDITAQVLAREREAADPRAALPGAICGQEQFEAQGTQELLRVRESGAKLSVLLADVDRLADINAELGREAGDLVVKEVAETCREYLRGNDLLARVGGDRFALLLPDTALAGAERVAQRLVEAFGNADLCLADGRPVPFTVSIGAAEATAETADLDALRARANEALERAKLDLVDHVCASG